MTGICSRQVLPDLARQDPHAMDLLSQLLTYDPAARITARKALRHPFFAECALAEAQAGDGSAPAGGDTIVGTQERDSTAVDGSCPAAQEETATAEERVSAPAVTAAPKPPLPRPSKRQCLRGAHVMAATPVFATAVLHCPRSVP